MAPRWSKILMGQDPVWVIQTFPLRASNFGAPSRLSPVKWKDSDGE
jgi:hypothetical protein